MLGAVGEGREVLCADIWQNAKEPDSEAGQPICSQVRETY